MHPLGLDIKFERGAFASQIGARSFGTELIEEARAVLHQVGQFLEPQQDTPICKRCDSRYLVFLAPINLQTELPKMRALST